MPEPRGFALPMPDRFAEVPARAIDTSVVHTYWFGRRLWLNGMGRCVQALLLLAAGVFLLTQITSTPNLVVQIAITGSLMALGGLAMAFCGFFALRVALKGNAAFAAASTRRSRVWPASISAGCRRPARR